MPAAQWRTAVHTSFQDGGAACHDDVASLQGPLPICVSSLDDFLDKHPACSAASDVAASETVSLPGSSVSACMAAMPWLLASTGQLACKRTLPALLSANTSPIGFRILVLTVVTAGALHAARRRPHLTSLLAHRQAYR